MTFQTVRTRMAPSPTGEYHIGSMHTLLYNWAFAQKNKGQFIIRIEDTDQKRLIPGAQKRLLNVIRDYGFSWDEGPRVGGPHSPYIQSKRLKIYQKYIKILLAKNLAYYCFCTPNRLQKMRSSKIAKKQKPKYDRHCLSLSARQLKKNLTNKKPFVIRLKIPDNQVIVCHDLIRGQIKINSREVDDQVLIKSNGMPTYHFAVVVDDHLMKISHIMRGDEWIPSLPKQVLLYKYFKWEIPTFIHLPVFLNPTGKGKMSKRHGAVSARSFLDQGYLSRAINNYLMLLGWNPGTDQEIFSLEEFIEQFDLKRLHKTQPNFDVKKLEFINGHYIRTLSDKELDVLLTPFLPKLKPATIKKFAPLLKERIGKLSDAASLTNFFHQQIKYSSSLLLQRKATKKLVKDMLTQTKKTLKKAKKWQTPALQKLLLNLIAQNKWNTGQFFMIFRVAICGATQTLPVVDCLPILGRAKTLKKLNQALKKLA